MYVYYLKLKASYPFAGGIRFEGFFDTKEQAEEKLKELEFDANTEAYEIRKIKKY